MTKDSPFEYFRTSPAIIRLAVMLYVRFPLSLRNIEALLHERGVGICYETVQIFGGIDLARSSLPRSGSEVSRG